MTARRIIAAALVAAASVGGAAVGAAEPPAVGADNPIVCGNKRITLISPTLIRLEYAVDGNFLDAPTMFAVNRDSMMTEGFTVTELDSSRVEINTGKVRMVFLNDNMPFGQGNTEFHFTRWGKSAKATARNLHSKTKRLNLGGSIPTLDGVASEIPLDDGLLSADGWYHLSDTGTEIITSDGWFERRSDRHVQDQYCFIYGDDFHAPFADLGLIAGHVPMTRKYMHGIWYSRWYPYDDDYIAGIVSGYRDNGFPLDVLSMDMDWHTIYDAKVGTGHNNTALGWTGHSWNRDLIPDPAATVAALHADSIYVCVNEHPHDGIRPHEYCYPAFMKAMNMDPASGETLLFNAGDRTYMENYIRESRRENHEIGIDFWWLDWQQDYLYPYVRGSHMRHIPWLNRLYYADTERDGLRGAGYSRWGGWGDHRYPMNFSGDARSNWDVLAFEVKLTQTSGNAGCYYWAHDIGGFAGESQPELLARWCQFGAVSAALRTHAHRGPLADRRPWIWGDKATRSMRASYRLRSEMMPYIYSTVYSTHKSMLPFTRCMPVDWPVDSMAYNRYAQYMLGDILLAAPVTKPGVGEDLVAQTEVWFPPVGNDIGWYDFFTDELYAGSSVAVVEKDIYSFPLFVRGGHLLPLQPFSYHPGSSHPEHLILRVYPGADGCNNTDELYEDDGISRLYLEGQYAVTPLRYTRRGNDVCVEIGPVQGTFEGQPQERSYTVELPAHTAIEDLKVNGRRTRSATSDDKRYSVDIPKQNIAKPVKIQFKIK
ncbi:MAG: DUF5110 domain-containing protein [Bacteroidales bacterium]|nr:DUF5110 domain-containing protein [Bacteroidales bacterium]